MSAFKVVKRSSLPTQSRFNGSSPGAPHVRLHKTGNLNFSKLACEVFMVPHPDGGPRPPRELAIAEYDEEARTLKLTGVDKPPRGLEPEDCFRLVWHTYKGTPFNCVLAAKRLLRYLGFEYQEAMDFPVVAMHPDAHSITLRLPQVGDLADEPPADQAAADQAPAAPNHS